MKRIASLLIITVVFISCTRNEKSDFEKHFLDKTLRINLIHTGNISDETYKVHNIYDDGLWNGRTKNMVNPYRLGKYFYEVRDVETDELLYSDGLSTYFSEWLMTDEAKDKKKSFNESIRLPFPQKPAKVIIYKIDSLDTTEPIWEYVIDRKTKSLMEPTKNHNNRIMRLLDSGDPKKKVDILILGDGYTLDEIKRFDADALRFYNIFINAEPFKSRKNDFNVHAVQVPPVNGKNSINACDGTFGYDRYALVNDEWAFREYATQAPYDYAIILMNTDKNCGGSLYNLYLTSAIRSQSEGYVITHELGHHIAGNVDKFYSYETECDSISFESYADELNDMIIKVLDLHTK